MTWSEGHRWSASVPLVNYKSVSFEFKLVIKVSSSNEVIRWEGGNKNHFFNGQQIHDILVNNEVQNFIASRLNSKTIQIGSIDGNSQLQHSGTYEESSIPNKSSKATLSYEKNSNTLFYHVYWQEN